MMISPLFTAEPKWQNPKPQKRIEALSELDLGNDKDAEILLALARDDSESAVRREAVKFLRDMDALTQIQNRDSDAGVRDDAAQRLNHLLAGKTTPPLPLELRRDRLQRITTPSTLMAVINEAGDMELRLAAIAQLHDETYLEDIVRHSAIAHLRLAAAERIHDPARLEALAELMRQKDKSVYKTIRQRLDQRTNTEKQARALQEKREALCLGMENHARSVLSPLYAAKAESLRQQWQELSAESTPEMA